MSSAQVPTLLKCAVDTLDQLQHSATPAIKEGKRRAAVLLDQRGERIDTGSTRASEAMASLVDTVVAKTKRNALAALQLAVGAGALLVSAAKSLQSRRR
jgi:hypothetical protein